MTSVQTSHPLIGSVVAGRWKLERFLGDGAMGCVLEATHVLIGRRAAIKILRRELLDRPHLRAYFLREARAVNWVNHVNIAEIYDLGEAEDGSAFLVMELLEGDRLVDRLDSGPLDLAQALDIVEQTAGALARAHDLGVIHRDLKPDHIFLVNRGGRRDFVKLIDFGLSHHGQEGQQAVTGGLLGTPGYIAPEVLRGEAVSPAADLYALGVVFFEMVTGRAPFLADDPGVLHELHSTKPPPSPCALRPDLPGDVAALISRLLEKDPLRRYPDAYRLLEDCRSLGRLRSPALDSSEPLVLQGPQTEATHSNRTIVSSVLKTALLARMAASAYPGRAAPTEVQERVDGLWSMLSELCQVEGELEVSEAIHSNARARAREASDAVALQIAELSRHSSRMTRRVEGAQVELGRLTLDRRRSGRDLRLLRDRIRALDGGSPGHTALSRLLHEAGVAAAQRQMKVEAIAKVKDKIHRWIGEAERAGQHADRLREQLRAQNARLETELGRQAKRVARLYDERTRLLAAEGEAARWLREHFGRRRECRSLMAELRRLDSDPGSIHQPAAAGDSVEKP